MFNKIIKKLKKRKTLKKDDKSPILRIEHALSADGKIYLYFIMNGNLSTEPFLEISGKCVFQLNHLLFNKKLYPRYVNICSCNPNMLYGNLTRTNVNSVCFCINAHVVDFIDRRW